MISRAESPTQASPTSKALTLSTLWNFLEPLVHASPALHPALCLRRLIQASHRAMRWGMSSTHHRWAGWGLTECPESMVGIHYQQHNKRLLTFRSWGTSSLKYWLKVSPISPQLVNILSLKQGPITHLLVNLGTFFLWRFHILILKQQPLMVVRRINWVKVLE